MNCLMNRFLKLLIQTFKSQKFTLKNLLIRHKKLYIKVYQFLLK